MCCKRLAGNTGRKNDANKRHLSTIARLCRAVSSQIRHVSTIGKNSVKQQYLPQKCLQYGELRPSNGCDRLAGLGHPVIFQRVSRLGSVTARQSSSGRQPNFAALNRGRHLCSAGRPSRWALVHILVFLCFMYCLWPRYGIGQAIILFPCGFFLSSSFFFPRLAAADWMSTILIHMVWP